MVLLVRMDLLRRRLNKMRRDWLIGQVVTTGKRLRRFQVVRGSMDSSLWPDDCAQVDSIIDTLERRQDRLLRKLREG